MKKENKNKKQTTQLPRGVPPNPAEREFRPQQKRGDTHARQTHEARSASLARKPAWPPRPKGPGRVRDRSHGTCIKWLSISCLLDRRGRHRPARVARRRPLSRALLGGFGGVDEAEHVVRGGGDVLHRRQAAPFLHLHSNSKPHATIRSPAFRTNERARRRRACASRTRSRGGVAGSTGPRRHRCPWS